MKKLLHLAIEKWYWFLFGAVVCGEAAVFLFFGENSYIAVHDDLDLFMGHFMAMKHSGTFFAHDAVVPILGGISRDYLSSEFSLYNILYYLLPPFHAYMCGYFLKIVIAEASVYLLAKDIYDTHSAAHAARTGRTGRNGQEAAAQGEDGDLWKKYRPIAVVCGLIYGLLPLFPTYGIAFASIPLVIFLLRRIYRGEGPWGSPSEQKKGRGWLLGCLLLFFYPLLSYFSYFGIFILGYLVLAILILWVRDGRKGKGKISWRLVAALFVLSAGYIVFEYRLFGQMLLSDTVTIRSTMAEDNFTAAQIVKTIWEVFSQAIFHAQPSHTRFLLPLCLLFFVYRVVCFLRKGQPGKILTDSFCLVLYFIIGNCLVYGFYYWGGLRELFETLIPPLEGFQFNRTVFFNPFLWYAALFLLVKYLYDRRKKWLGNALLLICLAVVVLTPAVYNDFYYTCYYHAYRLVKGVEVENLNYREFFSEALFDEIKEDIGYNGEYSIAYGMHPSVLSYNGISTLDGYLGFYPEEYKEAFGAMIAPATERVEEWNTYFWDWGARAYIFSGSGENTWNPVRNMQVSDDALYIDGDMFRKLGGKYLFSRIEISNGPELGFTLVGAYGGEGSPYTIYVYGQ
ncbi:MAG TPA: hypothetical protein H9717_13650 [Candidatus Eisenbergiella merdipullorum]|uniref:Uncharacterized protein n=1 Tax=Candidatus Eisenbergiella merdipullorum TaxID=2838553 RepID=A0A9D2I722_9FIRM|nr:hypothetical protein [Candidatus Eisenbergiella merdipullorum]